MQNLVLGGKGFAKRGEFGVNCFVSNCHHSPWLPNILSIICLYHPPFASSTVCIIIRLHHLHLQEDNAAHHCIPNFEAGQSASKK